MNIYFLILAYHDSRSCSGTSICMSKMWRRIYSSSSARFSYEKVSIAWKSVSALTMSNFRFWFFSSKRTKKTTTKCRSLKKPVIEPPQKSVHWNEKIGEIIFKSFFGEATKLQEILCHQENAKQREKKYYYYYIYYPLLPIRTPMMWKSFICFSYWLWC